MIAGSDTLPVMKRGELRALPVQRPATANQCGTGGGRVTFLNPHPGAGQVTVTAPASPAQCAPGHYMMFLISSDGVPSVAQILQIRAPALVAAAQEAPTASAAPDAREYLQVYAREAEVEGGQRHGRRGRHYWDLSVRHRGLLGRRL